MKLFLILKGDVYFRSFPETSVNRFNSLHFFAAIIYIKFPFQFQLSCSSAPCQNGGTCQENHGRDGSKCLCNIGFFGKYYEKGNEGAFIIENYETSLLHLTKKDAIVHAIFSV